MEILEGLPAVIPGRGRQEEMKIRYRSFIFLLLQRHQAKLERFHKSKMPLSGHFIFSCGEGGIRTLGTGLSPYNGLANRPFRPLRHLSSVLGMAKIQTIS